MKTRTRKQKDLNALAERFKNSKTAMVLGFSGLTVAKDQEFRNELRETGATYKVVKNTLARLAVDGTSFEASKKYFDGVTSIAWTDQDPVDLSKVISKYLKQETDVFIFKTGVVEGTEVDLERVNEIASLPSKDALIGKILYLLNAPAQRLATVLQAIPRDLALVVAQIGEGAEGASDAEASEEPKTAEAKVEPAAREAETGVPAEGKAKEAPRAKDDEPAAESNAAEAPKDGVKKSGE